MKTILLALFSAASLYASDIQVFFSPDGGCTEAVVENLGKAKTEVLVQAYSFTSAPIAKALVDAENRSDTQTHPPTEKRVVETGFSAEPGQVRQALCKSDN